MRHRRARGRRCRIRINGLGLVGKIEDGESARLKAIGQKDAELKELLTEGVGSILEGMNPKLIRVKLEAFVHKRGKPAKASPEKTGAGAPAAARG